MEWKCMLCILDCRVVSSGGRCDIERVGVMVGHDGKYGVDAGEGEMGWGGEGEENMVFNNASAHNGEMRGNRQYD